MNFIPSQLEIISRFDVDATLVKDSLEPNAKIFVYSIDAYGSPTRFVVANTWEQAFDAARNNLCPLGSDELHEAYGFDNDDEFQDALEESPDTLDIVDGYAYVDGGIVCVDHNETLNETTLESLFEQNYYLTFGKHTLSFRTGLKIHTYINA